MKTEPLGNPLFNIICLPEKVKLPEIAAIEKPFRQDQTPFCWWVDIDNVAEEVKAHLQSAKYNFFGDVPGFTMELAAHHQQNTVNNLQKIRISEIDNLIEFKKWCEILAKGFGFNDFMIDLYLNIFGSLIADKSKFIPLGAYNEQGSIVSTASILFDGKIAGFYNDSTLIDYRKQGITTSLYQKRIEICQQLGIEQITLQASPAATNIAQKQGFSKVKNYHIYLAK